MKKLFIDRNREICDFIGPKLDEESPNGDKQLYAIMISVIKDAYIDKKNCRIILNQHNAFLQRTWVLW